MQKIKQQGKNWYKKKISLKTCKKKKSMFMNKNKFSWCKSPFLCITNIHSLLYCSDSCDPVTGLHTWGKPRFCREVQRVNCFYYNKQNFIWYPSQISLATRFVHRHDNNNYALCIVQKMGNKKVKVQTLA